MSEKPVKRPFDYDSMSLNQLPSWFVNISYGLNLLRRAYDIKCFIDAIRSEKGVLVIHKHEDDHNRINTTLINWDNASDSKKRVLDYIYQRFGVDTSRVYLIRNMATGRILQINKELTPCFEVFMNTPPNML